MPIKYTILSIAVLVVFSVFISAYAATVRFYDDSLNLVDVKDYESEETIDFAQIKVGVSDNIAFWYIADASIPLDNYTVVNDMNIYSIPMVKEITSENELRDIRNFLNGRYMLVKDINLTKAWSPIGSAKKPFTGILNGGGHKISGLWVDNTSGTAFIGLFGRTYGSLIKDISVSIDVEKGLAGGSHVGVIAGSAINTTIVNSHSEGLIKGGIIIGGIVGSSISSTIRKSTSSCNIEARASVGGIVGIASRSYLERVSSSVTITIKEDLISLTDLYREALWQDNFIDYKEYTDSSVAIFFMDGLAGGITGYSYLVTVADSHFTGNIEGRDYSGGITGYLKGYSHGDDDGNEFRIDSVISNSYVTGNIIGKDYSGGIVGYSTSFTIANSYVSGKVKGQEQAGGVAGYIAGGDIVHSYFNGVVKGETNVGGITGGQWEETSVINSYAQGEIEGNSNVGGLAGSVSGWIHQSFFNGRVKGVDSVGGIAGYNVTGSISESYSEGIVNGENSVGGIAGKLSNSDTSYDHASINTSYSSAEVNGKENIGGIVGRTEYFQDIDSGEVYVKDVYFTGKIKGTGRYTGGVVGYNEGFLFRAYSLGSVEGGEYAGGDSRIFKE
jgi:hypothetical protein